MTRHDQRIATLERSHLKSGISGLPVELRMHSFQMTNELLGILLPVICIVFQTNQYRSCNGTFESYSFRQACAVRNEDTRYETSSETQGFKGEGDGKETGLAPFLLKPWVSEDGYEIALCYELVAPIKDAQKQLAQTSLISEF